MKKIALITLMLLALPQLAFAVRVDETVEASKSAEVEISIIAGKISVTAWDRDEVQVTGFYDEDVEEIDISSDGDDVMIEVEPLYDKYHGSSRSAELEIHMPRGGSLEIEAVSSRVDVRDIEGDFSLETISGSTRIDAPLRRLEVESISGSIKVEAHDTLRSASFESVSGEVEMSGRLRAGGNFSFETVSGSIVLRLPGDIEGEFDIETFSGSIDSDFGPRPRKTSEYLPSQSLSFTLGSGGADVMIESFSGRVKLIRE